METKKIKKEKKFDTVKTFRKIKEKIAEETENMSFEEFKNYLKENQMDPVV